MTMYRWFYNIGYKGKCSLHHHKIKKYNANPFLISPKTIQYPIRITMQYRLPQGGSQFFKGSNCPQTQASTRDKGVLIQGEETREEGRRLSYLQVSRLSSRCYHGSLGKNVKLHVKQKWETMEDKVGALDTFLSQSEEPLPNFLKRGFPKIMVYC